MEGGELTLSMTHILPAPPAVAFRAFTDPEELARWWGPSGFSTPSVELDLRVGGRYLFGMQPPDTGLFYLTGEFMEVDPPTRLAYTFLWEDPDPDDRATVVRLKLEDRGKSTEVSFTQGAFATEARRALHHQGWSDGFEKLAELLA